MMRCYIYYNCRWEDIRRIEERFGIPHCVTVTGETCKPVEIRDEDVELLKATQRRGYLQIRIKDDTV